MYVVLKITNVALRNHALVAAAIFTHEKAQLFGFDQASRSPCFAVSNKGGRNLVGDPLLIRVAMTYCVDHPGDSSETMQASSGQVGHVGHTAKRQQVMWANTMHSDTADDYHIIPAISEARAKRLGGINIITVE
ncbi:hypothetical protein BGV71_13115 [Burkholderia ubonensis]|nr:hypothetical protein BGV71_13115 [Burkholderia ubonensis]